MAGIIALVYIKRCVYKNKTTSWKSTTAKEDKQEQQKQQEQQQEQKMAADNLSLNWNLT